MREAIEDIIKALVDHTDEAFVEETAGAETVVYEIDVHPDDRGKIIGRGGEIIKAIRTILSAVGGREKTTYVVKVLEDGPAAHS